MRRPKLVDLLPLGYHWRHHPPGGRWFFVFISLVIAAGAVFLWLRH